MQFSDPPPSIPLPWASGAGPGYINSIPTASQIGITNGAASWTDGFPPLNFLAPSAGGVPPFGADANGGLNQISAGLQWIQAGGPLVYNSAFSTLIGGYPKGAIVASAAYPGQYYLCLVDNNTSNPDSSGAGWAVRGSVTVVSSSGSVTILSPAAYVKLWGGGGGGGGSATTAGTGGGGGGYTEGLITGLVIGNTITATIGAGGSAGSSTGNGGSGGETTFSSLVATGGSGGNGGSNAGGGAGSGSGGLLNLNGDGGGYGYPSGASGTYIGGQGGSTFCGAHTQFASGGGGHSAIYPGTGGGGGGYMSSTEYGGGNGAAGLIMIEWKF